MNFKIWFKSKPGWFQYSLLGATSYPALILFLMILAFITSPTRLRFIFETIIAIINSPAYFLTMYFIYKIFVIESYSSFVFYFIGMMIFFTIITGSLIGLVTFFARKIYQKLKSKN
jgi:hypothetical protein